MFENCIEIRKHFSDYADGLCDRDVLRSLRFHLAHCRSCERELEVRRAIQEDLRCLPVDRVPPEVSLRMRVRVSQHLHRNFLGHVAIFLENAIKPLMLPASAGVLTAIICFGLIMGSQVLPSNLAGEARDISTPPRVRALGPINLLTDEQAVVVVTHVDAKGRVSYYQVLSGQQSPVLMQRLNRMMNSSYFKPATMYGKPTEGQVVLSLQRITVRG
ncbi:MAG TPA: zf-HC2 domain-containing protein [Terriglobia bacterium]|nr:zf-HC2 domain-containing protein [Terriglobia bacterium]